MTSLDDALDNMRCGAVDRSLTLNGPHAKRLQRELEKDAVEVAPDPDPHAAIALLHHICGPNAFAITAIAAIEREIAALRWGHRDGDLTRREAALDAREDGLQHAVADLFRDLNRHCPETYQQLRRLFVAVRWPWLGL